MQMTGDVGGTRPIKGGEQPQQGGGGPEGLLPDLGDIKVHSLGELHAVLMGYGAKGKELWDSFQKNFLMMGMSMVQHAADRAKKASKEMREMH